MPEAASILFFAPAKPGNPGTSFEPKLAGLLELNLLTNAGFTFEP